MQIALQPGLVTLNLPRHLVYSLTQFFNFVYSSHTLAGSAEMTPTDLARTLAQRA